MLQIKNMHMLSHTELHVCVSACLYVFMCVRVLGGQKLMSLEQSDGIRHKLDWTIYKRLL